jgi:PTS system glucitol/sorbitol-specific IIC component
MCYTFGRFVDEKYKPAYYDAAVSFVHPITGLFPHANAGELFVYMGIATGLQQAGYDTGGLAIRYFIVGLIVILIRGLLTERIYLNMLGRNKA